MMHAIKDVPANYWIKFFKISTRNNGKRLLSGAYQGVRNDCFSENFAYVLNK